MIDWIRDTETGELFPVESDFNFEAPAHLEIPEYITIDYDKTKEMTITELQNQLIAAQNHIEAIESEKTSDNNSFVTVNEVSPEIVSTAEKRLNTDVNYEGKSKSFNFLASLQFFGVILLAFIAFAMGIYVFANENNIEISIPNIFEQQTVSEQELEEKQAENEDKSPLTYIIPPLISIIGIRFAVNFMRHMIDGA